jgi:hypothetical protein
MFFRSKLTTIATERNNPNAMGKHSRRRPDDGLMG